MPMPTSKFPHDDHVPDKDSDNDGTEDQFDAESPSPEAEAVAQAKRDVADSDARNAAEVAKKNADKVEKESYDALLHQRKEDLEKGAAEAAQTANSLRDQSHHIK